MQILLEQSFPVDIETPAAWDRCAALLPHALAASGFAREGSAVKARGNVVGVVTSGTFSPTLNKTIAMAYLDPEDREIGTALTVDVRGKDESALVVKLPFYKRGQ